MTGQFGNPDAPFRQARLGISTLNSVKSGEAPETFASFSTTYVILCLVKWPAKRKNGRPFLPTSTAGGCRQYLTFTGAGGKMSIYNRMKIADLQRCMFKSADTVACGTSLA